MWVLGIEPGPLQIPVTQRAPNTGPHNNMGWSPDEGAKLISSELPGVLRVYRAVAWAMSGQLFCSPNCVSWKGG